VNPDSNALKSEIPVGHRFVSINGAPVDGLDKKTAAGLIKSSEGAVTLVLKADPVGWHGARGSTELMLL
jgi:hypothetical protein